MSLEVVSVDRIRERTVHDSKLERCIKQQKISKIAVRAVEPPLSGLFKTKTTGHPHAPADEKRYLFTESTSALHSLICKATHTPIVGAVGWRRSSRRSSSCQADRGGGMGPPWIGGGGALASICISYTTQQKMTTAGNGKSNAPPHQGKGGQAPAL